MTQSLRAFTGIESNRQAMAHSLSTGTPQPQHQPTNTRGLKDHPVVRTQHRQKAVRLRRQSNAGRELLCFGASDFEVSSTPSSNEGPFGNEMTRTRLRFLVQICLPSVQDQLLITVSRTNAVRDVFDMGKQRIKISELTDSGLERVWGTGSM